MTIPEAKRKIGNRHRNILLVATIAMIIVTTGGTSTYLLTRPKNPFPAALRQSMQIPLYFPTQLPPHFAYDKTSLTSDPQNQTVFYSFKNASGKSINVNIQLKPKDYDIDAFYTRILSNIQGTATPYGDAKIGMMGHATVGILDTGKAWVIVKYNDTDFASMLANLMSSLKQY